MKPTYEIITLDNGKQVINALYPDGLMLSIPCDPANSDYQRYLEQQANVSEAKTK